MQAFLMLADAAQPDASGKLNMLGADWAIIGPRITPFALVIFFRASWEEADKIHPFTLRLTDGDGAPVLAPAENDGEPKPLVLEGQIAMSAHTPSDEDAIARKVEVHSNLAVSLPGIAALLKPGHHYRWSLEADEKELAEVSFAVRSESDREENASSEIT